jgi:hypothetical protein
MQVGDVRTKKDRDRLRVCLGVAAPNLRSTHTIDYQSNMDMDFPQGVSLAKRWTFSVGQALAGGESFFWGKIVFDKRSGIKLVVVAQQFFAGLDVV